MDLSIRGEGGEAKYESFTPNRRVSETVRNQSIKTAFREKNFRKFTNLAQVAEFQELQKSDNQRLNRKQTRDELDYKDFTSFRKFPKLNDSCFGPENKYHAFSTRKSLKIPEIEKSLEIKYKQKRDSESQDKKYKNYCNSNL